MTFMDTACLLGWAMAMACKWTFKQKISLGNDKNLQRLVQFYVWETPVRDTSAKGIPFSELGWKGGSFNTLQAEMRKSSGFPNDKWIKASGRKVEEKLRSVDRFDGYDCSFEFAIHTVKDGFNKTEALFYFVRNALAHGGFKISEYKGERYLVLENRQGSQLKGRAILREKSLLEWAKLLSKLRNAS